MRSQILVLHHRKSANESSGEERTERKERAIMVDLVGPRHEEIVVVFGNGNGPHGNGIV
jgi:hypothetical protein